MDSGLPAGKGNSGKLQSKQSPTSFSLGLLGYKPCLRGAPWHTLCIPIHLKDSDLEREARSTDNHQPSNSKYGFVLESLMSKSLRSLRVNRRGTRLIVRGTRFILSSLFLCTVFCQKIIQICLARVEGFPFLLHIQALSASAGASLVVMGMLKLSKLVRFLSEPTLRLMLCGSMLS